MVAIPKDTPKSFSLPPSLKRRTSKQEERRVLSLGTKGSCVSASLRSRTMKEVCHE